MAQSLYIVVVGCGRLGSILASRLSGQGHSVVAIDCNEKNFSGLSSEFSGFQVIGDAVELAVLEQAKTNQADCLFAVTDQDNINLMVAQVAKTVFDVPKVLARVFDPGKEEMYEQLGIATISPTKLSAEAFLQVFNQPQEVGA
ncbi:Trk system potassium uptake protein TrkA [Acaryochloris thomasi RCC1774]|uniref:Trk system potassium uptake protein TrkA n=1 Tax=Acaryochloris thomasi RCC1774 TaxID=1764569 RepID=A0A2W1JWX2_9CYAN|nr:TrkA family potassium uptake protein [Acaryochloris thomasi]PZD72867.1 Trk system potassium uptake protein TrkA [Acaryochloris thomasi RCC1774]